MQYFKVMKNGKLWTDFISRRDFAEEHVLNCVAEGDGVFEEFEILPMTKEEMEKYHETI